MSVFRLHRHDKGFAAIDNETLRDRGLSFRARGVLAYLLSQPPEFQASAETIAEDGPEGRDAIRTALQELEEHTYILREKVQDTAGHWSTVVHVYERPRGISAGAGGLTDAWESVVGLSSQDGMFPQVAPMTGKPTVGNPGDKELRRTTKTEDVDRSAGNPKANGEGRAKAKEIKERLAAELGKSEAS